MTRWHTRAKYFYRSWLRLFQARFLGDASNWRCKWVKKQRLRRLQWMKHCLHCGKHLNAWPFCKCCGCTWRTLIELKWTWCSALCTEALVCAGENSGRGWLSLAAESWYAACRDLVKMRWMRVKGEWEGWRKEGGGDFSRFLAGVRYQEAAKALLMPHTSSPASYTMK